MHNTNKRLVKFLPLFEELLNNLQNSEGEEYTSVLDEQLTQLKTLDKFYDLKQLPKFDYFSEEVQQIAIQLKAFLLKNNFSNNKGPMLIDLLVSPLEAKKLLTLMLCLEIEEVVLEIEKTAYENEKHILQIENNVKNEETIFELEKEILLLEKTISKNEESLLEMQILMLKSEKAGAPIAEKIEVVKPEICSWFLIKVLGGIITAGTAFALILILTCTSAIVPAVSLAIAPLAILGAGLTYYFFSGKATPSNKNTDELYNCPKNHLS